jgi:hypothetical protein
VLFKIKRSEEWLTENCVVVLDFKKSDLEIDDSSSQRRQSSETGKAGWVKAAWSRFGEDDASFWVHFESEAGRDLSWSEP